MKVLFVSGRELLTSVIYQWTYLGICLPHWHLVRLLHN